MKRNQSVKLCRCLSHGVELAAGWQCPALERLVQKKEFRPSYEQLVLEQSLMVVGERHRCTVRAQAHHATVEQITVSFYSQMRKVCSASEWWGLFWGANNGFRLAFAS